MSDEERNEIKAEALTEAAKDFRERAGVVWGGHNPWYTNGQHVADLAASWLEEMAEELLAPAEPEDLEPPMCINHKEVQHRDRKPPWCNECGWRWSKPAEPAKKIGKD